MEDPIMEMNQKVNDMQISEEEDVTEIEPLFMLEELPPFYSDGSSFRDFLRGLGVNVDDVLNHENRTNSYDLTPRAGYSLVPEGRSGCFRAIGPDAVKELVVPCADQALADFNSKHNTDYKLAEGYNDACLREKFHLGCYHIHCNFTAKPETKPLEDGDFYQRDFFVDADRNADGSINLISYSLLDYGEINYGCEMCPRQMCHPAC